MPTKEKGNQSSANYFHIFLQSTAFFLASYLMIYFLSGISLLYIAFDLDIPAKLFTNYVHFGIGQEDALWTTDAIVSVFMSQPVSSFVAGIVALVIYQLYENPPFSGVAMLIWLFLHGFNLTFGLLAEDLIMQTGLARVANVLGLELAVIVLTVGIAVFFLWKAGTFAAKMYYLDVETESTSEKAKFMHYWSFFLLPYFAGNFVIMLISWQTLAAKDFLIFAFMFICLLPPLFYRQQKEEKKYQSVKPNIKTTFFYLSISIFFLVLFKLTLNNGISL